MINLQNDSGAIYVFETNTIWNFWLKCLIFIQMLEKQLSKSYFSSPANIYANVDSSPFCTWKKMKPTQIYS